MESCFISFLFIVDADENFDRFAVDSRDMLWKKNGGGVISSTKNRRADGFSVAAKIN